MKTTLPPSVPLALTATLLSLSVTSLSGADLDRRDVDYARDVRPILADNCLVCHGPDEAARQAELRLDLAEFATRELDSGSRAIVPGDSSQSASIARMTATDPELRMPPPESGKSLTAAQIELVKAWIDQGAQYDAHWAFEPITRPELPLVAYRDWPHNGIDHFVLARLEARDWRPAPPATKEKWARRVHFDLLGLPPTLDELDRFLADQLPGADLRLLDRLFASPHYGERMAIDWLDGARYADSNGYQNDFHRSMWPWRDWVISAFNDNMPFDQFTIEQLAGDLLDHATPSQRVATGFNRNHRTVTEAGSIEEEWRVEYVVDRVETTAGVFLALTMGCARCHDHKYDPLSQREFYQFFAFFNNISEKGVYTETRGNVAPLVELPDVAQQARLDELDGQIDQLAQQIESLTAASRANCQRWLAGLKERATVAVPTAVVDIPLSQELTAVRRDGSQVQPGDTSIPPAQAESFLGPAVEFTGSEVLEYGNLVQPQHDMPAAISLWVKPVGPGAIVTKMDNSNQFRGFDLLVLGDLKLAIHMIHEWPGNALKIVTREPLPKQQWSHLVVTHDGSSRVAGLSIYVNGTRREVVREVDKLTATIATEQPLRIGKRSTDNFFYGGVRDVRLFDSALTSEDVRLLLEDGVARGAATWRDGQPTGDHQREIETLFLACGPDELTGGLGAARNRLAELRQQKADILKKVPTVMVMKELDTPRPAFVLTRGQYSTPDKSSPVTAERPAFLPPLPGGPPYDRLDLANWIVSSDNPLTARVVVNRLWQKFFGTGLVKTSEDFGVQSQPPSHPQLLGWLAAELIDSGWDLQHIQKLIVMSAAYRQSSRVPHDHYRRDPQNRFLARGPRHRLPAEAVRDNALAVSGLLVRKVGGPSVMPYQPEGLWAELAGGAKEDYHQEQGAGLYRRSLYIFRKRTVPHPSMATFDAPSWEMCQLKRATTNTPLQSLALMNDVTYIEAARKLAERMIRSGDVATARIQYGFRLATGRLPTIDEVAVLDAGRARYQAAYDGDLVAARKLLAHGDSPIDEAIPAPELAAYTMLANVLLNLDETLTKN